MQMLMLPCACRWELLIDLHIHWLHDRVPYTNNICWRTPINRRKAHSFNTFPCDCFIFRVTGLAPHYSPPASGPRSTANRQRFQNYISQSGTDFVLVVLAGGTCPLTYICIIRMTQCVKEDRIGSRVRTTHVPLPTCTIVFAHSMCMVS